MSKRTAKQDEAADPSDELDFDGRLERLEAIVRELEGAELGLEPAIERYAEGVELLKACHQSLERHSKRVEQLSADAERSLTPLVDDPDFGAADADPSEPGSSSGRPGTGRG
jgi:exodeoxyribonuclease VII small subunit